jgi:hypothetical protein
MFFNLTESPWICAGRQYSVRVRLLPLLVSSSSFGFTPDTSFPRTCGHTRTTALPCATLQRAACTRTASSHCSSRTRATSPVAYSPHAPTVCGAWTRTARVLVLPRVSNESFFRPLRSLEFQASLTCLSYETCDTSSFVLKILLCCDQRAAL